MKGAQPFIFNHPEDLGYTNYDDFEDYYLQLLKDLTQFNS